MPSDDPRDRLIIALDHPDQDSALFLVGRLADLCRFFKVGLELFSACGPRIVESLQKAGARVFLDLKMHDIPETVQRAVRVAASLGVELCTVHAAGGSDMLRRAAQAAEEASSGRLRLLGVTVLTSLDLVDLGEVGVKVPSVADAVLLRAELCQRCGLAGVVASPKEVAQLRATLGPDLWVVTPGVRPEGARAGSADDQKRTATVYQAILDGADQVVVGRPVRDAQDPRAACRQLLEEITRALESRAP